MSGVLQECPTRMESRPKQSQGGGTPPLRLCFRLRVTTPPPPPASPPMIHPPPRQVPWVSTPPPHHEICTSSPTPAPATKSHFTVHPLRQNNPPYSVARPSNPQTNQQAPINKDQQQRQQPQPHSAKDTTNNQQEHEPKQATKQQAKQRVAIVRPAQSLCFLCIQHALVLRGCGLLLGGALRPPQPPPHHEICTSSPTPAPATKSHFKVNPLKQNTFSTNQPSPRGGEGGGSPSPTICGGQNWRNYPRMPHRYMAVGQNMWQPHLQIITSTFSWH